MNKYHIIVLTVLVFSIVIVPYASAYYFSSRTNVPFWYLKPPFRTLSIATTEDAFFITISPVAPQNLGELITVQIRNSNNTVVEGATITITKEGTPLLNKISDKKGQITFEYPGAVTILQFSKEGYATDMKVLPKVPDEWIVVQNQNNITTILGIVTPAITLFGILLQQRKITLSVKEEKKKRKSSKSRS